MSQAAQLIQYDFLFNAAYLPIALPMNSAPIARVRDPANPRRNRRARIDLLT
jgi:hypothetical protein